MKMLKLNMNKIKDRIITSVSSEDALSNITPIVWSDEIVNGNKKVIIDNVIIEENNPCVKLETSF